MTHVFADSKNDTRRLSTQQNVINIKNNANSAIIAARLYKVINIDCKQ